MLRLDPGDRRIATTRRTFEVYEGGGEYNVARGLKRCFGLDTAVVTAFADDPVGDCFKISFIRVAWTSPWCAGSSTTAWAA